VTTASEALIEVDAGPEAAEVAEAWELARRVCDRALERAGRADGGVVLTLVDEATMADLNRRYRGREGPTDVLAFSQEEPGQGELAPEPQAGVPLGDVVVCLSRARHQAEAYGHSLRRELAFLALHGTLHLLGHDHGHPEEERRMMGEAEEILGAFGLGRGGEAG
jgi:probable rRNA maturation factor